MPCPINLTVQENDQPIPLFVEQLAVVNAVSPMVETEQTEAGAIITFHDLRGEHTVQLKNGEQGPAGENGTDGVSPAITVADITGGHRVTITDATGTHSFDVMDGNAEDAPVQDVQINGVSALNAQGIANIPIASADTPGVVVQGTVQIIGSAPTINGVSGVCYVCGEVSALEIIPPDTGIIDVVFNSGSTPTVLTVPNTVKWPEWFNATALKANTAYEINILDGMYGMVGIWN